MSAQYFGDTSKNWSAAPFPSDAFPPPTVSQGFEHERFDGVWILGASPISMLDELSSNGVPHISGEEISSPIQGSALINSHHAHPSTSAWYVISGVARENRAMQTQDEDEDEDTGAGVVR